MTAAQDVLNIVKQDQGLTALELAKSLHGPGAVASDVFPACQKLMNDGKIKRIGAGGRGDPFRYHLVLQP